MVYALHLKKLKSGVNNWNNWKKNNASIEINLCGVYLKKANLREADLSGANLKEANLSGAYLSKADLSGANLKEANLSGAYLSKANLSGANLSGANLSGADLKEANFNRSNLSGANLSGANLSGTDLKNVNLDGANFNDTVIPDQLFWIKYGLDIFNIYYQKAIFLSGNQLKELPKEIGELKNLTSINLSRNQLKELPKEIGGFKNLTSIDFSGNQLKELPKEIGEFKNLTSIDFSGNQLKELPKEIGELKNLTSINLSGDQLKELPKEIGELKNLTSINLSGNQLKELPKEIGELKNLTSINLSRNQLKELPKEIGKLKNLTSINLSRNQLKELPKEIGELKNLTSIDLSGNQLKELPKEIGKLKNLTSIDLSYNFLKFPPPEIIKQGNSATIEYLKKSFNKGKRLYEAKLIIVGQGGVGKTCLRKRLIENKYNEEEDTTEGIDIQEWNVIDDNTNNKKMIKLNVWDFGGQEIYHATHQFFLTQRSLYILVWDSRQEEEYGRIDYWLNTIETFASDSPIFLIMNKADIRNKDLNIKDLKKRHPQIISGKVSAKKNIGIINLKKIIVKKALKLPLMGTFWPLSWIKVRKLIEETNLNYASYKNYLDVCKKVEIEEKEASILSRYLHDLGIVLHFHEDTLLKDIMIFKPEWGTDAVYKVLDAPQVQKQNGILYDEDLSEIWSDKSLYPPDKYAIILRLMANFELAFPFSNKQQHVVAELLPIKEFEYDWRPKKCLQFEYHYEFLPTGIITRLIVRMYEYLMKQKDTYLCWREGAYFEYEGSQALIKMNFYTRIATIQIDGRKTREFLAIIRYHFDVIHKTIKKIKVKEKIPCICKIDCSYRFDYRVLLRREWKGFIDEYCGETDKKIKISSLLNGIENYKNRTKNRKGNMKKSKKTVININNTQGDITIGTDQSKINQYNNSNKEFIEVLDQLKDELSKLTIDQTNREAIDIQLKTLEDNAKSDKNNPVLMKSTLESIKTITQGALGSAMGSGLVETFKRVGMLIV